MNTPTLSSERDPTSQQCESSPDAPQGTASSPQPMPGRSVEENCSESQVVVNDDISEQADTAKEGVTEVSVHVGGSQLKPPLAAAGSTGTTNSAQQNGRESDSQSTAVPVEQSNVGAESVSVDTTGDQDRQRDSKRTVFDKKRATITSNHLPQRKRYLTLYY